MKIVFMGTPEFAVPSLKRLANDGCAIAAVIAQPDRRSGRGHRMCAPPVKQCACALGIPVLQFEKIKQPDGVAAIKKLAPDIIITAAFGQILSKEILDIPPMGCINVHASLLPKYRGAAPIQWAIINGEKRTGVTIMYMDEGLDTGDIISSCETDINPEDTGGTLYHRLADMGAALLSETLCKIAAGKAVRTPQNEADSSYYPPLSRDIAVIDWKKSAVDIANLVRALDPLMGAAAYMGENCIKIWRACAEQGRAEPGKIVCADAKNGLIVGTGCGLLRVREMQAPCCRRMSPCDFLRGRTLCGDCFCIKGPV